MGWLCGRALIGCEHGSGTLADAGKAPRIRRPLARPSPKLPPPRSDLAKKVGSTVSGVASRVAESITPAGGGSSKARPPQRREEQRRRGREDIYRPGGRGWQGWAALGRSGRIKGQGSVQIAHCTALRPLPQPSSPPRARASCPPHAADDPSFGGGLVGNLLGKAVGGMLRSAVGALGEQLREAQERAADVQAGSRGCLPSCLCSINEGAVPRRAVPPAPVALTPASPLPPRPRPAGPGRPPD